MGSEGILPHKNFKLRSSEMRFLAFRGQFSLLLCLIFFYIYVIQQNPTGFLLIVCVYLQEDFMCSPIVSCLACCHKHSVVCVLTERQVRNKSQFLISPYYIMWLIRKMEVNWKWLRTFNLLIDILIVFFLTLNLSSCLFTGAKLSICIVSVKER